MAGAAKSHAGRAKWKSVRLKECPRAIASGQGRVRRLAQGSSPRPTSWACRAGPNAYASRQQTNGSSGKPGNYAERRLIASRSLEDRTAWARSEVFRRTARGEIIFYGRSRGEHRGGREQDCRRNARGETRNRRRRRDGGASCSGARQNAAKTVMPDRTAARGAGAEP
jgi:hypothetical protein